MILLEKIGLICGIGAILSPLIVVNVIFILDYIYTYLKD